MIVGDSQAFPKREACSRLRGVRSAFRGFCGSIGDSRSSRSSTVPLSTESLVNRSTTRYGWPPTGSISTPPLSWRLVTSRISALPPTCATPFERANLMPQGDFASRNATIPRLENVQGKLAGETTTSRGNNEMRSGRMDPKGHDTRRCRHGSWKHGQAQSAGSYRFVTAVVSRLRRSGFFLAYPALARSANECRASGAKSTQLEDIIWVIRAQANPENGVGGRPACGRQAPLGSVTDLREITRRRRGLSSGRSGNEA